MGRTGVLLLGFGGPDSIEAVEPFMCNLMGREPSDELVAAVCRRYLAIGGASPLGEIAASIARALGEELARLGHEVPIEVGMRYWHPFIDASLGRLVEQGCDRVVCVSLSPFESKVASDAYREAVTEAAAQLGEVQIVEAPLVSEFGEFVEYLAAGTAAAITDLEPNEGAILAFTAHSLPESDLSADDPYVAGLRATASAVAEALGLEPGRDDAGAQLFGGFRAFGIDTAPRPWFLVYQSKGQRPGAWLGPDLDELIDAAAAAGVPAIVVCPVGFMTDHMETLYDLDIVSADRALLAGVEFVRAPVPNDDLKLVGAIAEAVADLL